jgi:hypothetical protein
MPDALERAAELDKQYGRNPDLATLPMYCTVFSLKDWYDAKDMRGTGGNDVNYAMDVPKEDSPDIAVLREKGAIIFAGGGRQQRQRRRSERTCEGDEVHTRYEPAVRAMEWSDLQSVRHGSRAARHQ